MQQKHVRRLALAATAVFLAGGAVMGVGPVAPAGAGPITNPFELQLIGRYASGDASIDGEPGGAEISVFDAESQRIFVTNGTNEELDILDASDPTNPTLVDSVSTGNDLQSVAVHDGLVAVAVQGDAKTDPGTVQFFDVDGNTAGPSVTVGALPDMLTFTADGTKVLVANEGEPDSYCADGTDPVGSVSIVNVASRTAQTAGFTSFDGQESALRAEGIRIYGPNASTSEDFEPEYIAISPDQQTAQVTLQENNAIAIVDIASATVTDVVPLGYKDHNGAGQGLDPSDRDNGSNGPAVLIDEFPVYGMYQPDTIGAFEADGDAYYAMANEGDSREWECLFGEGTDDAETERAGTIGMDATIFSGLTSNAKLGRLTVTRFFPATFNGDDDFTSLYALGARSFSIRDSSGALVWDSGDDLEQITSTLEAPPLTKRFNMDWNDEDGVPNSFDSRSDNKGPEPEALGIGSAYGRTFAFVGLERVGGVALYDITDPESPELVQYLNTSDFTGDYIDGAETAAGGDIAPESMHFVPAHESPTGKPLVIGSYELSGTTAIFELDGPELSVNAKTVYDERNHSQRIRSVEVSLDQPSPYPVTVGFVLTPKNASPFEDYVPTGGLLQFSPGQTSAFISVAVLGDKKVEKNERVRIDLVLPNGALLDQATGKLVIRNDD